MYALVPRGLFGVKPLTNPGGGGYNGLRLWRRNKVKFQFYLIDLRMRKYRPQNGGHFFLGLKMC